MNDSWRELTRVGDAWQLFLTDTCGEALGETCDSWLSAEERQRYLELRSDESRHDFLATHALCRAALSHYTDVPPWEWTFCRDPQGKPKLLGPAEYTSLRFNLTHTAGLVVCLISRIGDVGVDAEKTSRVVDVAQIARHFFSIREQALLEKLPADQQLVRFYTQWVVREAYLKGNGIGLDFAPERLTMSFSMDDRQLAIGGWQLCVHWPSAEHVAAAAIYRGEQHPSLSVRWLQAEDLLRTWIQSSKSRRHNVAM